MKKWEFCIIFMSLVGLVLVSSTSCSGSSEGGDKFEILAPEAETIPTIDGVIEEDEWSEVKIYDNVSNVSSDNLHTLKYGMKHDSQWLYVLVIVGDDSYDNSDCLLVGRMDNAQHSVAMNGAGAFGKPFVAKSLIGVSNSLSSLEGTGACSYDNGEYTFEFRVPVGYFPDTIAIAHTDKGSRLQDIWSPYYCEIVRDNFSEESGWGLPLVWIGVGGGALSAVMAGVLWWRYF